MNGVKIPITAALKITAEKPFIKENHKAGEVPPDIRETRADPEITRANPTAAKDGKDEKIS